jgi:hypothetical protein
VLARGDFLGEFALLTEAPPYEGHAAIPHWHALSLQRFSIQAKMG